MKIEFVDIQNFRKLKKCRIPFGAKETLLVGANNSGKTSATDALINFLDSEKHKRFSVTDFTLSNWITINEFAESWLSKEPSDAKGTVLNDWQSWCPSIDVWLNVSVSEVQKVAHLIPTLKWNGEPLGVRLVYQPKDLETLRADFLLHYQAAKILTEKNQNLSLWPRDMKDFLERELKSHFEIKAYLLDPLKMDKLQSLRPEASPLESDPFKGLFKVDTIDAQRGFSDPNGEYSKAGCSLSSQLNEYYDRHLNPTDLPDDKDIDALEAISSAQTLFDERLENSFKKALGEIKKLGYPGFSDPDIKLSSRVNPIESLNHEAGVVFDIQNKNFGNQSFSLPEKYNGLGYKNLINIVFKLITYRDKWQRVGKAQQRQKENIAIEPIHLVLIEEPEAHLHAQVQQVFIRKAYDVLRNDVDDKFTTQLVVSTHSSYIAHEAGFDKLRYFKRKPTTSTEQVPSAEAVDLSKIFSISKRKYSEAKQIIMTARFVSRYLKTTHSDLFFANGIVLVEGTAERMLLPHFICHNYPDTLNQSYISILEVGGAHAHRLKPLIEALGVPTLVITDTDATKKKEITDVNGLKKYVYTSTQPKRNNGLFIGSDTLNLWFDWKGKNLDEVLDLAQEEKIKDNVRVAYQCGIEVKFKRDEDAQEAIPYTFEDAITLSNLTQFKKMKSSTGMIKAMHLATLEDTLEGCCQGLYEALKGTKAKMALDLIYDVNPEDLIIPEYIKQGLDWLENELDLSHKDISLTVQEGTSLLVEGNQDD